MNLIVIPFHDWRKSEKEGFRTRDAHFIKALSKNSRVNNLIVINRPNTLLEIIYNKNKRHIQGEILFKKGRYTLYKTDNKVYVVDYCSRDIFNQAIKKHFWFVQKYTDNGYSEFIKEACDILNIQNVKLISQNIFAYKLAIRIDASNKIFDAWDNFLKFPAYKSFRKELENGYQELSDNSFTWITNSDENVLFFKTKFNVKNIGLIKNGVKVDFSSDNIIIKPDDLSNIKKPIIGFGGKISYLLNTDLINYLSKMNSEKSFVFVGQILDKEVYKKINKNKNVFFLGDKHYEEYPRYVHNFDICMVPYNIDEKQHGGDSIKVYEYLSTGKKVIGTIGNGLQDMEKYLYLADTPEQFSLALKNIENDKPLIEINKYSWESKAQELLNLLTE